MSDNFSKYNGGIMEENLDTQAWKAGYSSVPAFLRGQKRAKKLADWQQRNDENSTATSERSSRLPQHLDRPYCGSYTQRALHPAQSEEAQVAKSSPIPALSPQEFHEAKTAFEWFNYQHTLSDDRKKWALRFGVALRLVLPQESWVGLDMTRRNLVLSLINSEDARQKFQ
jgi:hypothetical protein